MLNQYILPNGKHTESSKKMRVEWKKACKPIEKTLDITALEFNLSLWEHNKHIIFVENGAWHNTLKMSVKTITKTIALINKTA